MEHSICKFKGNLTDNNKILNMLLETCAEHHLSVINTSHHSFYPQGFTAICLLAESHFSIHTFPESHVCYVDLYSCDNNLKTSDVLKTFAHKLNCELMDIRTIDRDNYREINSGTLF